MDEVHPYNAILEGFNKKNAQQKISTKINGAPPASMVVWCLYLRFNDGNSFHRLRLTMGSNEFLGCHCYNEFFFPSVFQ